MLTLYIEYKTFFFYSRVWREQQCLIVLFKKNQIGHIGSTILNSQKLRADLAFQQLRKSPYISPFCNKRTNTSSNTGIHPYIHSGVFYP